MLLCFNIIYRITVQPKMKKSELRKLISDYVLLKNKSKKHDFSEQLKKIEHRYFHETGHSIFDDLSKSNLRL